MSRFGMPQGIEVSKIKSSPFQVRVSYGDIPSLADNIKDLGQMEPILVRPIGDSFEIVHGHRRTKAVESLGWKHIQAYIKDLTDLEAVRIQGSENIHRKDYDPIEEAHLYKMYRNTYETENGSLPSNATVGKEFKKSDKHVMNRLNLLKLPEETQKHIAEGNLGTKKAEQLAKLTTSRNGVPTSPTGKAGQTQPKTDEFKKQIEELTYYVAKDDVGESILDTSKGVAMAVQLIKEGVSVPEAVTEAKKDEVVRKATQLAQKGTDPKTILKGILASQIDENEVQAAKREALVKNIVAMFTTGNLVCPKCGGDCISWGCDHERLILE